MEITARNTNALARKVYPLIHDVGVQVQTRNGPAIRFDEVTTINLLRPQERVCFSAARDANPFFHLVEAMAMLCAHNSVPLMAHYAGNMRNFSDDGKTFNAFYGTRMHQHNQLLTVIKNLRANPDSRQELVMLWDIADLTKQTKDKACNILMLFEVRDGKLRMVTFNRSNDAIWGGVTGANVVHFSFFQEFVALSLGLQVGTWSHVSANLHIYLDNPKRENILQEAIFNLNPQGCGNDYPESIPLLAPDEDPVGFLEQLCSFFHHHELHLLDPITVSMDDLPDMASPFIQKVLRPMACTWESWKVLGERGDRLAHWNWAIEALDWQDAARMWLSSRGAL